MRSAAVTMATFACLLTAKPAWALQWHLQPEARNLATLVVDETRHRLVMFGGANYSGAFNDVWAISLESPNIYQWSRIATSGTPPSGRFGHAAICDETHDRMLIFGGKTASGGETDELWQLDLSTATWQKITQPETAPSARVFVSAVYHPDRHSMLVIDGKYGSGGIDEVWELDLDSMTWREAEVEGSHPAGRWSYALALDRDSNALIVFGGQAGDELVNESWKLNLKPGSEHWTELQPTGDLPPALANCAFCYVPEQRALYTFAGFTYPIFTFLNDLYVLQLNSMSWTHLEPTGDLPVERRCPAGAYDSNNGVFLTFGGETYNGMLGDMPYLDIAYLEVGEWHSPRPVPSHPRLDLSSINHRTVSIRCQLPKAGSVNARIVDASGRVIKTLLTGSTAAGFYELLWDGKDSTGRPAASGNYFCHLTTESGGTSAKFALTD